MIKLTRIDDRLVHGQVAFAWTSALGVDCLLVANDNAAGDQFLVMTLGLAKPVGAKLLVKTLEDAAAYLKDERNKNQKILLIVNSVKDAFTISSKVDEIKSVNFGGIRTKAGAKPISKAVAVSEEDIVLIKEMLAKGLELEIRQVPTDRKQLLQNIV